MAGQRQPGPWGLDAGVIDAGTSARITTPPPGPTGQDDRARGSFARSGAGAGTLDAAAERLEDLTRAIAAFRQSGSWSKLQPIVFQVVGQYSFGLGVLYGIGENLVGSVVDLGQLAKTFLLADLYDRAHQPVFSAAVGPTAPLQRLIGDTSMRAFGSELEEAHRERDELIAELRYAMTHLGEVVDGVAGSYVSKWNRFESLSQQRTLSSQFEAGRIFGEVLLEVVSLIGGGAAAVRAASKVPRLARLARVRIPSKSGTRASGAAQAGGSQVPITPSQARPAGPPVAEPPPRTPPAKSVASALAGSEFNGVKAQRIRPGSDTKVAVVGRNMEQVEKYAQGLKHNGYSAEVFAGDSAISRDAQSAWMDLKKTYAPNRIPDDVVRTSRMFHENRAWAQKLVDEGYTVIDVGNPTGQGLSPFYEMEKAALFPAK